MTEQEYIGPQLSAINGAAVDKAMRGELASNGKTDAKSHFEDLCQAMQKAFQEYEKSLAKEAA